MESSVRSLCHTCKEDDNTSEATTWCTECEAFLCADCLKLHKSLTSTKEHLTLLVKEYHNLPKFIKETTCRCIEHRKRFELFCFFHSCACCTQCFVDKHQACQNFSTLKDFLKDIKSSTSMSLLRKELIDLKEIFENTLKYINKRLDENEIQKEKVIAEIRATRKSIAEYLDGLEQKLLGDLESDNEKLRSNIKTIAQQIMSHESHISELSDGLSKIVQYATRLQTYVGMKNIENEISKNEKYLKCLETDGYLNENNIKVNISSAIIEIRQHIETFGNISVDSQPNTFQPFTVRRNEAQYLVRKIPEKSLQLPLSENLSINSCLILPDGKFLLLVHNKKCLMLFNSGGEFERDVMTFHENTDDVCYVHDCVVAISLCNAKKVALVDFEKNEIIKTINLSRACYGLSSDGETLVISNIDDKSITLLNLKEMSEKVLYGITAYCISYFKGHIYGTNWENDTINCYKSNGETQWTFTHPDINKPIGISLDKFGFIYIASCDSCKIVALSPNAESCRIILCKNDGIKNPWAIDISKANGMILVSPEYIDGNNEVQVFSK